MVRKVLAVVAVAAALGGVVFWALTQPLAVAPADLPAYAPDVANGRTMFYAGGCAACHATPGHPDRTVLGGVLIVLMLLVVVYAWMLGRSR